MQRAVTKPFWNVFFEPRASLASSPVCQSNSDSLLFWSSKTGFALRNLLYRDGWRFSFLKIWSHSFAPLGTPLIADPFSG